MDDMELPYVRTGYEYVIPQRVGKMFVQRAKMDGEVTNIGKTGLRVLYSDGSKGGVDLGVLVGSAEGTVYPSDLTTNLKVGDKVVADQPLSWNRKFFEMDLFENRLAYKHTRMANVMMMEGAITYEDNCSASIDFVNGVTSDILKLHSYVIDFRDTIIDPVEVGATVAAGQPTMVIQDHNTMQSEVDEDELKASLLNLTKDVPKIEYDGTVERIEVYYHGDLEQMSPSLRALAEASDKVLLKRARDAGRKQYSGQVGIDYRSSGKALPLNTCEVRVYVNMVDSLTNIGKIVVCNQLKTTIGNIEETNYTENGDPVDIKFSRIAVDARIVGSFDEIGLLGTCMDLVPPKIEELWKK